MFKWLVNLFKKCEHEWKYLDERTETMGSYGKYKRVVIVTCFCPKCKAVDEVGSKAWYRYLKKCQIIKEYEKQNKE